MFIKILTSDILRLTSVFAMLVFRGLRVSQHRYGLDARALSLQDVGGFETHS